MTSCFVVMICTGFVWQGFGSGGATGVASVKSCQKLPPSPTELVPAGSKTDLPLAKAKPISDCGSASGITYLKRKKTPCLTAFAAERGVRICGRNNSADTKVSGEGGGGGSPGAGDFSPAACDEDLGEAGCPPAAHRAPQWSRYPPAARGGPHIGVDGCTQRRL